jgi:peptide/nickel transport system substrate-binding protein
MGLVGRLDSLNPITSNNAPLRELTSLLFDSLLRVDPQSGRLQPGLAQSWEYSPDGRRVTFHLPDDLRWSDGTPLTAADLAASLTATRHPALQAFSRLDASGDNELVLTLAQIDCAAVTNLAVLPLLPSAEITATVPRGSGPFKVADRGERSLTLTPNPTFWGEEPLLDELIIRLLDSNDDLPVALSEGQFDLIGPLQGPLPVVDTPGFNKLVYPAAQMVYLAINYDPKNGEPLPSEVRQALVLALDRPAILEELSSEAGYLLAGPLLPRHWAASPELSLPDYDPEQARQLLAQAGLRDTDGDGWLDQYGERLELGIRLNGQNGLHQNLGWLLSSYYRDIGVFVRAEGVAFDSVVDDLFTHDFYLAIYSWPLLADPDQRPYWHSIENTVGLGLNFTSYHNSR